MRRWLIVNPAAGRLRDSDGYARLRALADERGVEVHETTEADGAEALARAAVREGVDTVVAAGGDGTISEVINGLSADFARCRLAVVPLGTANDFAHTLGVPVDDLPAALAVLDEGGGEERRVDLVRSCRLDAERGAGAGEDRVRYVVNASTGGFSEVVHDRLDDDLKRRWGALAYLRAAVDAMPSAVYYDAALDVDGERIATNTAAIVIANGRSAGGMTVAPDADVEDRRMDLIVVQTQTFFEQLRLAGQYLAGTHLDSEHVCYRRAKRVRIETTPPMRFSTDGELIGETPVEFKVVPHALRVLVPVPRPTSPA